MGSDEGAPRILYIDDDPALARLVQRRLDRLGFSVTVALGGDEGQRLAASAHFDAIALDHYMPGRDGLEMLEILRSESDAPPIIFVTGAEEPRIAVTALKSGAADYVVKDAAGGFVELLAASIHQEMARAQLRREKEAAERELRESRDRLERLAAQQAILLREVNHRVANSLQLISSLIELQARKVPDEAARMMLRVAAERVEAVTLVHQRLYTGGDVEFVDMDAYLAGLVKELSRATQAEARGIWIELDAGPIRLQTDYAVALGLVVNELVTNALKYAYPDRSGPVRVSLRENGGQLCLTVEDDGCGYSVSQSPRGTGLGSLIVRSMAQRLGAEFAIDTGSHGTRYTLCFPANAITSDRAA